MSTRNVTTYTEFKGVRIGITPVEQEGELFALITTRNHNHGLYRLNRFGDNTLTPGGRLTAATVRKLKAYLGGEGEE